MIELYTGFVGSGKSYCATRLACRIIDAKLSNQYVIANFPLLPKRKMFHFLHKKEEDKYKKNDRFIFKNNDELTVDYLINKSLEKGWNEKESSCLLIFDEASIPFNSRTFHQSDRMDWIKFLSQSRKFGYDVIFITQDARMIDRQIRSLCEFEVAHKKLNNMPLLGWLSLFKLTIFAQVTYWNGTNARFTRGQLRLIRYSKKYAERYDTLKLFDLEL